MQSLLFLRQACGSNKFSSIGPIQKSLTQMSNKALDTLSRTAT